MPLNDIIHRERADAIRSLVVRASMTNRLAKVTESKVGRNHLYEQKARALSKLLEIGAADVDEYSVSRALVTIALPNQRCLHVPLARLSPAARGIVRSTLMQRFVEPATWNGELS